MTQIQNSTPPWPTVVDDDGSGRTGTKQLKTSFWDVIRDAINFLIHSPTNPNQTPAMTTDEVVEARGSTGSLDTRLDVSMNEDGTLKSLSAYYLTPAIYQAGIGAKNLVDNGDLELWNAGTTSAPDSWFLMGAGATISREATIGAGPYVARITRTGDDAHFYQYVIAAADWPAHERLEGRKIVAMIVGKASAASRLRFSIEDGFAATFSDYHPGDGLAHVMTVVHTVSASATELSFQIVVANGAATCDVSGIQLFVADLAPSDWQPKTREVYATALRPGIVSTLAQEFAGVKDFLDHPRFEPGTSTGAWAQVRGLLNAQYDSKGITTASETDAHTYTLKANTLSANGRVLKITAWGTIGGGAANKTIKFYLGATAFTVLPAHATISNTWRIEVLVVRTGANAQDVIGMFLARSGITEGTFGTATITDTADIVLKTTIQSSAGNPGDIIEEGFLVEVVG